MEFINGNKFAALEGGDIIYKKIDDVMHFQPSAKPYKLITHNGDLPIAEHHKRILDDPNLIKWYGTNVTISHPKLQSIPIGLDRSMPERIYTDVLNNEGFELTRDNLFYFRHWGDSMVKNYRDSVRSAIQKQGYEQSPKLGITEHLIELKKAMFCPCPNGNGIDTHSMWECIYMGCIPIVEWNINTEYFSDLPILYISDWNTLSRMGMGEYLYKKIREKSLEKADFNYWKQLITK